MTGPYWNAGIFDGPVSNIDSTQKNELGAIREDAGRILQYVKFTTTVPNPYEWVAIDLAQFTNPYHVAQLGASVTQVPIGVAEYGGSVGSFGWITRLGAATAKTATTAYAGCPLRPGGTAGTLGPLFTASGTPTQMPTFGIAVATGVANGSCVMVQAL